LNSKTSKFDEILNSKIKEIKQTELQNSESLLKVLEEHKKKIQNLTSQLNEKTNKEDKFKLILIEKDNEILNLKNLLKSVKNDIEGKLFSL